MKFTKKSGCVKLWVKLIKQKRYTYADVPALFNLREVVKEVLDEEGIPTE